jgi:GDPmannose 4,6-dehydratase
MKTALITGVTGQDGAYLSKKLIDEGYHVVGLTRSYNSVNTNKLSFIGVLNSIEIKEVDLLDFVSVLKIIEKFNPDEIYNLSAQSSVGLSFEQPIGTVNYNVLTVLNILEAIRISNLSIKFYQASSSEIFGNSITNCPINESTPHRPESPYGISKSTAYWLTVNYRKSYGIYACSGILFNHESPLRSGNFFIKKVIDSAIEISKHKRDCLEVGNLEVKRDFGYSPDYMDAVYLMMQQPNDRVEDYVICSGKSLTLRQIVEYVFNYLNIPLEKIVVNKRLFRPNEIFDIYGDSSKAQHNLGWSYDKDFFNILKLIIDESISASK